ncbi:MAG: hypothetical protein HYY37_04465 [Candidatus Aenigmarchaeota archaeon]|nr:hypothetical protein [Candidatus Aenigmarchaeota archaeon]
MQQILLDTNVLLLPVQRKVDIFDELRDAELLVLASSIRELEQLSKGKGRPGAQAKATLQLLRSRNISILPTKLRGDSAIMQYARANPSVTVATNDKQLIKALQAKGITILRLRQKKYFIEE